MTNNDTCNCYDCIHINNCGSLERTRFRTKQRLESFKLSSSKKCPDYQREIKSTEKAN